MAPWLAATLAVLAACSRDEVGRKPAPAAPSSPPAPPPPETTPAAPPPVTAPEAPAPAAAAAPGETVELQLASVADTMTFDKPRLSVPTRARVHLTLKNGASNVTLLHNWVLVKPGTEASVAAAGLKLGQPAGYLDDHDTDVLAHTPLAKGGATAEVTFIAPAPGDYPYICTFPGHYLMMKGILTVTP